MPLGNPLFAYEDEVAFDIDLGDEGTQTLFGKVYIIDAYGTFEQNEEASYDIMVDGYPAPGQQCLFKHIRESLVEPA